MGITQELAKYYSDLKFHQLQEEVVDRVKYFFSISLEWPVGVLR